MSSLMSVVLDEDRLAEAWVRDWPPVFLALTLDVRAVMPLSVGELDASSISSLGFSLFMYIFGWRMSVQIFTYG